MDEPLRAHTLNEIDYYLAVTPCTHCGRGPVVADRSDPPPPPDPAADGAKGGEATIRARCRRCSGKVELRFRWRFDVADDADDPDCINPSDEPSNIIDLGQWVSLYSLFREEASAAKSPAVARTFARQAALCLAEALKFHRGKELPPESAFFHEASAAAFRKNPVNYARTRLRDLQGLLPAPAHGRGRPSRPRRGRSHPWWKFWE